MVTAAWIDVVASLCMRLIIVCMCMCLFVVLCVIVCMCVFLFIVFIDVHCICLFVVFCVFLGLFCSQRLHDLGPAPRKRLEDRREAYIYIYIYIHI